MVTQSHPGSAIAIASIPSRTFLITPFERVLFSLLFVLATGLGWLLVSLILQTLHTPAMPTFWQRNGLIEAFITGLVAGSIISAAQWTVLRRYVPDWLWILAGTAGYVLLMTMLVAWGGLLEQILSQVAGTPWSNLLPSSAIALLSRLAQTLLASVCAIWLGLSQWLLLRQYATPSRWWIMVPPLAVLLSSGIFALAEWLPFIPLNTALDLSVDAGALGAGILGATQAIALCALHRREIKPTTLASLLTTAPEIARYERVQQLMKQLRRELNQAWLSEIVGDRALTYLVGMTDAGRIMAYRPTNILAVNQVDLTPLPELVDAHAAVLRADPTQPLARFQVTFLPSGKLVVRSWRGVPIAWIAIGLLILVLFASLLAAQLANVADGLGMLSP